MEPYSHDITEGKKILIYGDIGKSNYVNHFKKYHNTKNFQAPDYTNKKKIDSILLGSYNTIDDVEAYLGSDCEILYEQGSYGKCPKLSKILDKFDYIVVTNNLSLIRLITYYSYYGRNFIPFKVGQYTYFTCKNK